MSSKLTTAPLPQLHLPPKLVPPINEWSNKTSILIFKKPFSGLFPRMPTTVPTAPNGAKLYPKTIILTTLKFYYH